MKTAAFTELGPLPSELKRAHELPRFESSPAEILKNGRDLIAQSKRSIDEICELKDSELSFSQVFGRLDDLFFEESKAISRIHLLQNTHPDKAIREAAQQIQVEYQKWSVERDYREDLYRVLKQTAQSLSDIAGEDEKLIQEILRDYRRRGMDLSPEKRDQLKEWNQKLAELETRFSTAINEYRAELLVEEAELIGLDPSFVNSLEMKEGKRVVHLDAPEFRPIMEFAEKESLRRDLLHLKYNTARESNSALLDQIVQLRHGIAKALSYESWNDYVIETRMAKKPQKVFEFLESIENQLRPKAEKDLKELAELKATLPHQESSQVQIWDFYFLSSRLKKEKYRVDSRQIKEFFALDSVLKGLFEISKRIFQIQIRELGAGEFPTWHEEVRLLQVEDPHGELLGYCYLDLHPREGKYGHAAAFSLLQGKWRADQTYQCPVSAMVCNFPRTLNGEAPLIPHEEVETLFHEFGHILHNILTRAKYIRFSGTNVAWDFVEAPSQIMENWVWKAESLGLLAKHFKNPERTLDRELIDKMNQAKQAGAALFYLRQVSLAKADLELHRAPSPSAVEKVNQVLSQTFLPLPEDTAFAAGWGHLMGYDSGYYGYAWADVMAADLFSKFSEAGIFDQETGSRLRREIFEVGSARDENKSLEAFLGRPLSDKAFFKELGAA